MAFPIEIDATKLIATNFMIPGVTPTWQPTREETPSKRIWQMEPGTYQFVLSSSSVPPVEFEVRTDGTVFYSDAVAGLLEGRGHSTLIVVGYLITLDARPLKVATGVFRLSDVSGWLPTAEVHQVGLLPGTYGLGIATGPIAGAQFEVTRDSPLDQKIQYADVLDVHREPGDLRPPGFLTGTGTSTLTLAGYAVTLDARPLKVATGNFRISDLGSWMSTSEPQHVRLLPTQYGFIVNAAVSVALFEVIFGGTLSYAPEWDVSNGGMFQRKDKTTLTILGYSLLVDAIAFQGVSVVLTPFNIVIDTAASVPQTIQLIPYRDLVLELRGTPPQSAVFDMEHNGSITLLEPYPFVLLEQRDGHPLIRLTTNTLREKRPCRPPAMSAAT